MVLDPISMMMQPAFIGSEQAGMNAVPTVGPRLQPSFHTTVSQAQSLDTAMLYSAHNAFQAPSERSNPNSGIDQSKLSGFRGKNSNERQLADSLIAQHYGFMKV